MRPSRLLPISLGAGESPPAAWMDHKYCKGSGTSGRVGGQRLGHGYQAGVPS